jgi:hypothetical protein
MKKFKLILLLVYMSIIAFSQSNTFIIKAIDALGQSDSVIIGYNVNATTGINEVLGESDYFELPYQDIDLRSIQRDSITKDGLWLSGNGDFSTAPFPNNIDLKKDYRSFSGKEHFILKLSAINYPVVIKISYLNFNDDIPFCIFYNNEYADSINVVELHNLYDLNQDTIYIFRSSTENLLMGFHPQVIIDNIETSNNNSKFSLYPSISSNVITLNNFESKKKQIYIYNSLGICVKYFELNKSLTIDISNFQSGVYFAKTGNSVKRFIKN